MKKENLKMMRVTNNKINKRTDEEIIKLIQERM